MCTAAPLKWRVDMLPRPYRSPEVLKKNQKLKEAAQEKAAEKAEQEIQARIEAAVAAALAEEREKVKKEKEAKVEGV